MSVDAASGCGSGPGSTRTTSCPRFLNSIAVVTPLMPAPTTITFDIEESCHSERSEESLICTPTPCQPGKSEMFRFAQHDKTIGCAHSKRLTPVGYVFLRGERCGGALRGESGFCLLYGHRSGCRPAGGAPALQKPRINSPFASRVRAPAMSCVCNK